MFGIKVVHAYKALTKLLSRSKENKNLATCLEPRPWPSRAPKLREGRPGFHDPAKDRPGTPSLGMGRPNDKVHPYGRPTPMRRLHDWPSLEQDPYG
uniref:Uncharacterized protein n=1 Tax=Cannabis sativa TaxID=3483 RepID=A0A803PBN9_CANSA